MLAFKAQEIEELADVYFFRRFGMVLARAARGLGLTPTQLTIVGMFVGVFAGGLFYDARLGFLAFALLIVHGVIDSSDGQLARMTGRSTEFGRMLDGVSGYVTHAAIYVGLAAGLVHQIQSGTRGGSVAGIVAWMLAAGLVNVVHAQAYDYHRTAYVRYAIDAQVRSSDLGGDVRPMTGAILRGYEAIEMGLAGLHPKVEHAIAMRAVDGRVRDDDRERYRAFFYWPVRGWNLFGDNTRFYAIGVLAWLARPEWFFMFLLGPMNVAFVTIWLWQARVDRRFLQTL